MRRLWAFVLVLGLAAIAGCSLFRSKPTPPTAVQEATSSEESRPAGARPTSGSAPETGEAIPAVTLDWVAIPGASFTMGALDGETDERPAHSVTVSPFELTRTEVTVTQYRACVAAGACSEAGSGSAFCNADREGRDDHPVNCVTWGQALAFAHWVGGRLPSEAEWEIAARAGDEQRRYPWGAARPDCERAVFAERRRPGCGTAGTAPVCSRPAGNGAGDVCDLAGNVWEWVADCWHGSYAGAPADGSEWKAGCVGNFRTYRGGSWEDVAEKLRAANRAGLAPGRQDPAIGFRVAR